MIDAIASGDLITRVPDRLWRATPGFLAVASPTGEVLSAEGSASAIWRALERPRRFDELCSELAEAHGIDVDQVRVDVAEFVDELRSHGHVTIEADRDT